MELFLNAIALFLNIIFDMLKAVLSPPGELTGVVSLASTVKTQFFIVVVCLFVIVSTGFCSFSYVNRAAVIKKSLAPLLDLLRRCSKQQKKVDDALLEELRVAASKSAVISDAWHEFDETLVVEPRIDENIPGKVFNTRPASEFFGFETIIGTRVNLRFYSSLPSLLTGIGLLFTFIAILVGLAEAYPEVGPANVADTHKGIERLIQSLSGKFLSSICALLLATCFTILDKGLSGRLHAMHHELLRLVDRSFVRQSSEHVLKKIESATSEQSNVLRKLGGDLVRPITTGVQEGLNPMIARLGEALDKIDRERQENNLSAIQSLVDQFKEAMLGSASKQLDGLSGSLSTTATVLQQANEQSRASQEQVRALLQQLDNFFERQSVSSENQVQHLTEAVERMATGLESSARNSGDQLSSSIERLLERIEETGQAQLAETAKQSKHLSEIMEATVARVEGSFSETLLKQTEDSGRRFDQISSNVQSVIESLRSSTEGATGAFSSSLTSVLERLELASSRQVEEAQRQSAALSAFVNQLVGDVRTGLSATTDGLSGQISGILERIEHSSRAQLEESRKQTEQLSAVFVGMTESAKASFQGVAQGFGSDVSSILGRLEQSSTVHTENSEKQSQAVGNLVTSLVEQLEQRFSAITDNLSSVLRDQRLNMEQIGATRVALDEALRTFATGIRESSDTLSGLREASGAMRSTVNSFHKIVEDASLMQRTSGSLIDQARQTGELYQQITQQHSHLLGEYDRVFESIGQNLASQLRMISENLELYQKQVKDGTTNFLKIYDDHMSSATERLGASVGGLSEYLDVLGDTLSRARRVEVAG
jgi:hypothetical protein